MWAALAVIIASQVNLGQSLTKASLRVMGTVLGVLAAWILFMLFPQNRWMFMCSLSLWVGLAVYLMQGSGRQYFWQVAAFTSLIIWFFAGEDFSASFDKGVERALETALGVVVYSVIAILFWPVRSRPALDKATTNLAEAQQKLSTTIFSQLGGQAPSSSLAKLQIAMLEADAKVNESLRNAMIDSFEVWERREQWERYGRQASALTRSILRLSDSLGSLAGMDLHSLLPGFTEFSTTIEQRLVAARKLVAGEEGMVIPAPLDLEISPGKLQELTAFQVASVSVIRTELLALESHTRALIASIRDIEECTEMGKLQPVAGEDGWTGLLMPDPERTIKVVRVIAGLWLAYFAYLYLPGLPGGKMAVMLAGTLCISLVLLPPVSIMLVSLSVTLAMLIAGFLYFFIIIELASFFGLALLIFGWTFLIYWLLSAPRLQPARMLVLLFTQIVIGIQNVQLYSFTNYLTLFMTCMVALFVVSLVENIPLSNRPERVFARQIRQFFRSSAYLTSQRHGSKKGGWDWVAKGARLYHRQIVMQAPKQLAVCARNLLMLQPPGASKQQLLQMVNLIRLISDQVLALHTVTSRRGSGSRPDELQQALQHWQSWGQGTMRALAGMSIGPQSSQRGGKADEKWREAKRLALQNVEETIHQSLRRKEAPLSILPGVALSLDTLGVARHLSDSLEQFADITEQVDWDKLLESRFAS